MSSYLECVGVLFGVLYLILISKGIRWGWVSGIFSAIIYVYLTYETQLYLQAALQLFYVFLGIWAFMNWGREKSIEIVKMSVKTNLLLLFFGVCLIFFINYLLSFTNQNRATIDSIVTVFSVIATVLTALKYIENWIYWWGINVLAIYLFYTQGLEFTVLLYGAYFVISIYGFREWRLKMKTTNEKG